MTDVTSGSNSGREAGSLPFPAERVGTVNEDMPFDHLVVVMMENHSFDNLLGGMSLSRGDVDGLTFDNGAATNANPSGDGPTPQVTAFPCPNTAQASNVTQTWRATHEQINGRAMDGFVRASSGAREPMGYYTE